MPSAKKPTPDQAIASLIRSLATEIVENPTRSMQATFQSLTDAHKWLLFSMLNFDEREIPLNNLKVRFESLCPPDSANTFNIVISHLTEAFITVREGNLVGWIHPTCRDLAISNLSDSHLQRHRFLSHCSIDGLRLSLSIGGGSSGRILAPLLGTEADWEAFLTNVNWKDRKAALDLLNSALKTLAQQPKYQSLYATLRKYTLRILKEYRQNAISLRRSLIFSEIHVLLDISRHLHTRFWIPNLAQYIRDACEDVLELDQNDDPWESSEIENLAMVFTSLLQSNKRLARLSVKTALAQKACERLLHHGREAAGDAEASHNDSADDCSDLADSVESVAGSYKSIATCLADLIGDDGGFSDLSYEYSGEAESIRDIARELKNESRDDDESDHVDRTRSASDDEIRNVFNDL